MEFNNISPPTTLKFPILLGGPNSVACQLVDGLPIILPVAIKGTHLEPPHLPNAKVLCINAIFKDKDYVVRLLDVDMHSLEHLRIETDLYSPGTNRLIRAPGPNVYTLFASRLPALHTLMLRDTLVHLDMPISSNLRFLHLELREMEQHRILLATFLGFLQSCVALEKLWVDKYIDVWTVPPAGVEAPPEVSLENHLKQLTHVRFGDVPHVVSKILSRLVIPPRIDVMAVGYVAAHLEVGFRTMLPNHVANLPIIRDATEIRARDVEGTAPVLSVATGPNAAFNMELVPSPMIGRHPGLLLYHMINTLDIYKDSPAKKIRVTGNLKHTNGPLWARALHHFPNLEVLDVEDIQQGPTSALNGLLSALNSPSPVDQGVLCPRLQRFRFLGGIYGGSPLEVARYCFTQRTRRGAEQLRELELDLALTPDLAWGPAAVKRHQQALAPVASTVVLRIAAPS